MSSVYQIITRPCAEIAPELQQNLSPLLARIYAARGIVSLSQLDLKLSRLLPAQQLKGLTDAVNVIDQAIDQQSRILIVGDFDADGATSTALMMLALTQMGAQVNYLVPDRFKYGYGLTPEIVELAINDYQPEVIITVDNGISSHAGVERAHQAHIKVVITDHHLTTKQPPVCAAVVNPNQPECRFVSKSLAGVGVAFYVLATLATQRKQQGKTTVQLAQYLDIVALGTVADVAMLDHNNRILVMAGIQRIRQSACRPGILALLEIAGRKAEKINPQDLGFILGPRINAAGRMDNMRIGIECLLASNFEEAWPLACQLDALNQQRRRVEKSMQEEALQLLNNSKAISLTTTPPAIVLFEPTWHQGVIGIVAGRLKERFHRPSIVFAPSENADFIKGSARSIEGVHIRDAIEQVAEQHPDLITHFGGHAMAAGLTLPKQHFSAFAEQFQHIIAAHDAALFEQVCLTDGSLSANELSIDTIHELAQAGPWGQGFMPPLFAGIFNIIEYRWLQDKHLKLVISHPDNSQRIDAIYFNAIKSKNNKLERQVHLVYQLEINEFRGQQKLQLMIQRLSHPDIVTDQAS